MAKFTKKAIINSFIKLLNTTSFDRITVKDIVEDCGINRNTFYYNFKDIYALVDEILQNETNKLIAEHTPYESWQEGFVYAADFALKNKKAIYHLKNSDKKNRLEKYLQNVVYDVIITFIRKEAEGVNVSEEDICFIADFYKYALVGLIDKWLDTGMHEDFMSIIDKTSILFDHNIKNAIITIAERKNRQI